MNHNYLEIAEIFAQARKKHPKCGTVIADIVRGLTVHFMEKDSNFSPTAFLNLCELRLEDAERILNKPKGGAA